MFSRLFFSFFILMGSCQAATYNDLAKAALERTKQKVLYAPGYVKIPYPMGDVPEGTGVCTDVVIRSYRALGIDLQELVHKDMKANFEKYPHKMWGLKQPDTNIDHRRVPNLQVFFEDKGESLIISQNATDYQPGDIVTWNLLTPPRSLPHIGIVSYTKSKDGTRCLIVHNIGAGPKLEDILFQYEITGHYRYGLEGEERPASTS